MYVSFVIKKKNLFYILTMLNFSWKLKFVCNSVLGIYLQAFLNFFSEKIKLKSRGYVVHSSAINRLKILCPSRMTPPTPI